ncbi:6603_t:CDS:2 [Ambispora leptoticha]|uniref:6603_t:CDS:1 n=1 Tax=Ambispora leptoticha TaxID=144679 RepID=A0A9N9H793_9GLOM|nr:6603_t:CDS:2 [Ambispora leptoticha]
MRFLICSVTGCSCKCFATNQDDASSTCAECNHDKEEHVSNDTGCSEPSCSCELFKPSYEESSCSVCKHGEKAHTRIIGEVADEVSTTPPPPSTIKREQLTAPEGTIWFYNREDPYFFLTNFIEGYPIKAALPDTICEGGDGENSSNNNNNNNGTTSSSATIAQRYPYYSQEKLWPTSEHLFQAMKFKDTNPDVAERIRRCRSPREALNMARRHQEYVDPKWQERNVDAMLWVVKQKFFQHRILAQYLLETGDLKLVEHTELDKFWGDGGDGTGQNKLGKVLMKVRELLRQKWDKRGQNWQSPSGNNRIVNRQNPLPVPPKKDSRIVISNRTHFEVPLSPPTPPPHLILPQRTNDLNLLPIHTLQTTQTFFIHTDNNREENLTEKIHL